MTHEWVRAWWSAFGGQGAAAALLLDRDGDLRAGASLVRDSAHALHAAANDYTEDWDLLADDAAASMLLWRRISELGRARVAFRGLSTASADLAAEALRAAGYRVAIGRDQLCPYLALPKTWDAYLATLSKKRRSRVRYERRRLEREGELSLRTITGPGLDADLGRFLRLEASGWKAAAGTALLQDPNAIRLYTDFAHGAASRGWLRLLLLELDGVAIAGDYSCVLADTAFLVKTTFDERHARFSPGSVLRAEALRAAIGEGLARYEFLGGPEPYKLRWAGGLRERHFLQAYRGFALPIFVYRHKLRPLARPLRSLLSRRFAA